MASVNSCGVTLPPGCIQASGVISLTVELERDLQSQSLQAGVSWFQHTLGKAISSASRCHIFLFQLGHSILWINFSVPRSDRGVVLMQHYTISVIM